MDQTFMRDAHQCFSPLSWPLAPQQAVTLAAERTPRALWVHEGRVWLTRQAQDGPPQDIWLAAGQSQLLPPGTEWVAEAWPRARVSVVQAAPSPASARPGPRPFWPLPWRTRPATIALAPGCPTPPMRPAATLAPSRPADDAETAFL